MKKGLCMLLAGVMLFAAGCGARPAASEATPKASSEAAAPSSAVSESAAFAVEAPAKTELIISAAASLTDAMEELKTVYAESHPEITLTFNLGASGTLQQQIEQGAPTDVFFSAGKKQMTALAEKGLMEDATVKDILENKVVLIVPKDATPLTSFEDLAGDGIQQIGVGEPESVPVGQYTAEIFQSLGLTEELQPKLVLAKDVREVLSWVDTGNADAGIVYATDAKISEKSQVCAEAPVGSHKPVVYPVGVVKDSANPDAAKAFVEFLFTPEAQTVFASYGFSPAA